MKMIATNLSYRAFFVNVWLYCLLAAMSAQGQEVTPATVLDYMLKQIDAAASASDGTGYEYARGMAYFRALQYENSLKSFQKAITVEPENPLFLGMIANCHFHLHQYEDAVKWYQKTASVNPAYPKAYLRLGLSLERLNRPVEALEAYQKSIKATPDQQSSLYYAAKILFDQGKLEESLQFIKTLRSSSDEYTEPIYLQAQIARKQGDMDAAKALMAEFQEKRKQEHVAFDELPRLNDDNSARQAASSTHFDLALILFESDRPSDALAQLEAGIDLDPNDINTRLNALEMAMDRDQIDFVENQLRWLVKTDAKNGYYAYRLGVLLGMKKQYQEAEPFLQRAVSLLPNNPNALRGLIDCLIELRRDYPLALSLSLDLVDMDASAASYDLLSRAYYINGRLDESIEAMGKASQIDPNNPVYKKRYQALLSRRNQ